MQLRSLMEVFEVVGLWEVTLHHVNEAIVVLDSAARVPHEECSGLSESATDLGAEVWVPLAGETARQIYHRKIHRSKWWRESDDQGWKPKQKQVLFIVCHVRGISSFLFGFESISRTIVLSTHCFTILLFWLAKIVYYFAYVTNRLSYLLIYYLIFFYFKNFSNHDLELIFKK